MPSIILAPSGEVLQAIGSARLPLLIVITDAKFDPDSGDDLTEYNEIHEMECIFVQLRARNAVRDLVKAGWNAKFVPFVEGRTSLNGRRTDKCLLQPMLKPSKTEVVVVAPVIFCASDQRFYIRAASTFVSNLNQVFDDQRKPRH